MSPLDNKAMSPLDNKAMSPLDNKAISLLDNKAMPLMNNLSNPFQALVSLYSLQWTNLGQDGSTKPTWKLHWESREIWSL